MSESVTMWLSEQSRIVEVSGRSPEALRLVGPDDQVWAQWPIKQADLAEAVERTQHQLAAQMPNGKHRAQLIIIDNKSEQWAAFPIVLQGSNAAAATAAQETRTLQQAAAIAISNMESVVVSQNNMIQRLSERNEELMENVGVLVETVMNYQSDNIEVQLKIREHEESKERKDKLLEFAGPMLQQVTGLLGAEFVQRALEAKKRRAERKEQSKTNANGTNGAGSNGAGNGGQQQPANGAAHDSAVPAQESAPNGAANGKGARANGARGAGRGDSKRKVARQTQAAAKRTAKALATGKTLKPAKARTKPLTRSKRQ